MAEAEKNEQVTLSKKELETLVSKAARDAVQQATTELMANVARKDGASADPEMFQRMGQAIALAIAEVSDQGTSRKRVAPEVLAARAAANQLMVKLINDAREAGAKPEYRLVAKTYLAERLIEPYMPGPNKQVIPTEIVWKGAPNQAMRPLNAVAKAIYEAFQASIGSIDEKFKGLDGRPFYMTPGGVVVKGDPVRSRREIPEALLAADDDLRVATQNDPTAAFVQVLGTVAAPARQNVVRRADQVL